MNATDILIYTLFAYSIVAAVFTFMPSTFSFSRRTVEKEKFQKSGMRKFLTSLIISLVAGLIYADVLSNDWTEIAQFTGAVVVVTALLGTRLFLYASDESPK